MEKQFYTWDQFEDDCNKLSDILKTKEESLDNIYGVPRGGLILAVRLSHKLGLPLISDQSLINENTLIVDDIADTGRTLELFDNVKKCATVTLFYNPQSSSKPTYYARHKDKWVVFPWEEEETSKYDGTINK